MTEFDQTTNEITLILNNKYNQGNFANKNIIESEIYLRFCSLLVLKKPSKFTVILDDNEENLTAQQDESSQESIADKRRISQEAENTVRVHFESFKFEIFSITDFNILAQSWLEKLDQPEAVAHWTRNAHCIPIILQKTEFFSLNFIYWISL